MACPSSFNIALFLLVLSTKNVSAVNVLVFGDSQGDTGPTYQVVEDELTQHNIPHNVVNVAVGGTLSCGWAQDPQAIAKAAQSHFGDAGPDLVWFTAGGNDLAGDAVYHTCLDNASDSDAALTCLQSATDRLMPCTTALLDALWVAFPNAKVGMYNYEVGCLVGDCVSAAEEFMGGSFCARQDDPVSCIVTAIVYWQSMYVDALQLRYPAPRYTGMNVLGASQQASGVAGASVGHPVTTEGSRCDWIVACVHPKYGTPTATAIGQAMWDLWLKDATGFSNQTISV